MANVDRPRGLRPVKHMNGNPYNGEINTYYVPSGDSVALFIGDPVTLAGSADATGKYPTVKQAVAGTTNLIVGVVVGFGLTPEIAAIANDLEKRYRLASTAMYVYVVDDFNVIFEIQEVSGGTALAAAQIGNNAPIVVGSGNTDTGLSGVELNNSGETAATEQIRILRLAPGLDNAIGEHAKWWVMINEHAFNQELGV